MSSLNKNNFFNDMPTVRYRLFERAIIYYIDSLQAGEAVIGFPEIDLARATQLYEKFKQNEFGEMEVKQLHACFDYYVKAIVAPIMGLTNEYSPLDITLYQALSEHEQYLVRYESLLGRGGAKIIMMYYGIYDEHNPSNPIEKEIDTEKRIAELTEYFEKYKEKCSSDLCDNKCFSCLCKQCEVADVTAIFGRVVVYRGHSGVDFVLERCCLECAIDNYRYYTPAIIIETKGGRIYKHKYEY